MCESFPECLGPCHGGPVEYTCLFLPPRPRPSPVHYRGRLPAFPRPNDFMTDRLFETAAISLCSGPQVRLPDRSYRCSSSPQGSRGFYVRAEHGSLPPCASDMLTRPGNWWCGSQLHPACPSTLTSTVTTIPLAPNPQSDSTSPTEVSLSFNQLTGLDKGTY
jgi:hypothetical protein